MPKIAVEQLLSLVTELFQKVGTPAEHARLVAAHLVDSNLAGHDSHGVMRVQQYCSAIANGELDPCAVPTIERESVSGAALDGRLSFGQVAAHKAMALAISKARQVGTAAITLRNCYHSGRLGLYSQLAADQGLIGVVMVNAGGGGQSVAPFGGIEARLATNPLSIAAPTCGEFPLVLDVATSMAPEGKIRDCFRRGKDLPDGWIIDSHGRSSVNPQDFYGDLPGALLPLGGSVGYKGFGLAVMIDVLAGALSGAGCCSREWTPSRDGILFIVIDIEQYVNLKYFRDQVAQLIEHVKSCPPAPGSPGVFVPGELEYRETQIRRRTGVAIDEQTWQEIRTISNRYGMTAAIDGTHDRDGGPHVLLTGSGSGTTHDKAAS